MKVNNSISEKELEEMAREQQREYMRRWRRENKDKVNAYMRKYRKENPEKIAEINKRYWKKKALEEMEKVKEG